MEAKEYAGAYRDALLNDVIPFWLKHSPDKEYGGYFTCLERDGTVFDTDKFMWLQCRQVWCFSMLYNQVAREQQWLDTALQGAAFLLKHGRDASGNWYFSLTREGRPLVQAYNIFSDCFAAMAFGQLYKATGNEEYAQVAVSTFHNILSRQKNPKGQFSKTVPGTRPLLSFSLPMILSNLVVEIGHVLDPALVNHTIDRAIHLVMDVFYQPETGIILEHVTPEGHFSDTFEGRLVSPGHGLEAMWFMMDLATRTADKQLTAKATEVALALLEYGWDQEHGGIFYFRDIRNKPPQQLEWDQKLWWVHGEALVCMLKGYLHTGNDQCRQWFERLHTYTWQHFADPGHGEWYGYLNREGQPLTTQKGGKWKGCFHVPRCLYQSWQTLDAIAVRQQAETFTTK